MKIKLYVSTLMISMLSLNSMAAGVQTTSASTMSIGKACTLIFFPMIIAAMIIFGFIGAGAIVVSDVSDFSIVVGNPARVIGDARKLDVGTICFKETF